jgi:hypothetical protein
MTFLELNRQTVFICAIFIVATHLKHNDDLVASAALSHSTVEPRSAHCAIIGTVALEFRMWMNALHLGNASALSAPTVLKVNG